MKASGRKRGERGSAASEHKGRRRGGDECERHPGVYSRTRGRVDRLKALLAGLRTCERIERGVVSTNPFSTFSFSPARRLSPFPYAHAGDLTSTDVDCSRGHDVKINTDLIK